MSKYKYSSLRLSPVALTVLFSLYHGNVLADQKNISAVSDITEFDPSFLNVDDKSTVDLRRFAKGSSATPGIYKIAIFVNDQLLSNEDIEFKAANDNVVYPCLNASLLKNVSFDFNKLPKDFFPAENQGVCIDITDKLPESKVIFDSNEQRLNITIPQVYMKNVAQGTVSPALWDSGVPAMLLGYNISGYNSESRGQTFNSLFAGVNAGINVGPWYLRHNGSYSKLANISGKYSSINTYLQRDIPVLKSRMLAGQSNTTGEIFDTLPFTGFQLSTDDRMLPESLRGYAPEIRGIARTNARVTVRQAGQILYETTVTPGAFLINDLYPTGYGGDLDVTVTEADGTQQTFSVPYAAVSQLLRPGASRFSLTAGELRSDSVRNKPELYQATYQYGLTNALTGYGGLQLSQNYYAAQLGTAVGTTFGALSFDVTQAHTNLGGNLSSSGKSLSGQSYQVSYSKSINETNSNISLAAYRFSTDGYMDFLTAAQSREAVESGYSPDSIWRAKNRMTLTYSQGLPDDWGQLYLSGSLQNYWNKDGTDEQYQVGYNNRYKQLTWGVSASRSYNSFGGQQTSYLLSFSLPLGREDNVHTPQLRTDLSYDTNGRTGQQVTASGTGGESSQFSYGITAMHSNQGGGSSGSLSGNYMSPYSSLNASVSTGKNYRSASAGMNGTVIAHSGGVSLTPYTSETFALVEAKGAEGAKVSSYPGVYIDSHGYAVVPYLNPYQMNDIYIDPKGISDRTELSNTSQKIAPYSGAVVKVKYDTKTGSPVLINALYKGAPVPFGADVIDSKGNVVGSTGQGGQLFARVTEDTGTLRVRWGDAGKVQCSIKYHLMPQVKDSKNIAIQHFDSVCES